jgi:hypothetical protein
LFELGNSWPSNPLHTVNISHITGFPDPEAGMLSLNNLTSNPEMYGFVFINNLVATYKYPVSGIGLGSASCVYGNVPIVSLKNCFTSYRFTTMPWSPTLLGILRRPGRTAICLCRTYKMLVSFDLVRALRYPTNCEQTVPTKTVARVARISVLTLSA